MQKRTEVKVIINDRPFCIMGIDDEENLQKIATYLNSKYAAVKEIKGYKNLDKDKKEMLVMINVADDYLKSRQHLTEKQSELEQKDADIFNLKHDMLADRARIKELEEQIERVKAARMEDQKKIVRLETEISNYRKGRN